jgi:hypothetical protein
MINVDIKLDAMASLYRTIIGLRVIYLIHNSDAIVYTAIIINPHFKSPQSYNEQHPKHPLFYYYIFHHIHRLEF